MPVKVEDNIGMAENHGAGRLVFRNPRGNKRYYQFHVDLTPNDFFYEWSTDGVDWSNTPVQIDSDNLLSADVKIRDDGSQLIVYVVFVDVGGDNARDLKYVRGTIGDSADTITFGTVQTVDAALNTQITSTGHGCAIARTNNGRLVIGHTEDTTVHGRDYRQLFLVGSDDDSAAPTWATGSKLTLDDPSGDTDNEDKGQVFISMDGYGLAYPNKVSALYRVPQGTNATNYSCRSRQPEWDGSSFTVLQQQTLAGSGGDSGRVLSLLVDPYDWTHAAYRDDDTSEDDTEHAFLPIPSLTGPAERNELVNDNLPTEVALAIDTSPAEDVPTSTEANSGFVITGAATVHEALDDGKNHDVDATYITGDNSADSMRIGGFDGGITRIAFAARGLTASSTWDIATFKDGVIVETVATGQTVDVLSNYIWEATGITTDADWNEIRIQGLCR